MMNRKAWIAAIFLAACSKKAEESMDLTKMFPSNGGGANKIMDVTLEAKEEPAQYFYPNANKRDPFTPLIGADAAASAKSGVQAGLQKGELSKLELKGILRDRKGKVALISSADGEPYVLKSGRIYDRKNRMVSGVSGIIKENSVVLISQNRTITELSLRKREEETGPANPRTQ